MEERRRFPRAKYPCKIILSTREGKEEHSIHTENISSGGLRVILENRLRINTPVDTEVVIGTKKIKSKGRVVWTVDIQAPGADKPNLFDTGIEFTQLTPEDREFLAELIEELLQKPE